MAPEALAASGRRGDKKPPKVQKGRLAQLVERLLYTQDVGGSIPSPPTMLRPKYERPRDSREGVHHETRSDALLVHGVLQACAG